MTSRRKLFQYAQTSVAPQRSQSAGFSPSGRPGGSTRPGSSTRPDSSPRPDSSTRPGPGPQSSGFDPAPVGIISTQPAPGVSVHPGAGYPGGVGTGGAVNPTIRMLYPELLDDQGSIVNSPHCYLPNTDPQARPTVDRGRPPERPLGRPW